MMYDDLISGVTDAKSKNLPNLVVMVSEFSKAFMETLQFRKVQDDTYLLARSDYDFAIDVLTRLKNKTYVTEEYL